MGLTENRMILSKELLITRPFGKSPDKLIIKLTLLDCITSGL